MPIRRSPNSVGHIPPQPSRYRLEWAVAINRNRWSQSIGISGRNQPVRAFVINAVLADGRVHDPMARLWAQAERIRAYLAHRRADDEITCAIRALRRFLATPTPGLWFDQLTAGNVFIYEPARATSLYHIVGAVAEVSAAIPGSFALRGSKSLKFTL